MLHIQYTNPDESWLTSQNSQVEGLDEIPLIWYSFLCDIIFRTKQADLSTHFGWVPVLHFVKIMKLVINDLEVNSSAVYDFSESEDWLRFQKSADDSVEISASYAKQKIIVPYEELRSAFRKFSKGVDIDLLASHPTLSKNANYVGTMALSDAKENK